MREQLCKVLCNRQVAASQQRYEISDRFQYCNLRSDNVLLQIYHKVTRRRCDATVVYATAEKLVLSQYSPQ